MHLIIIIVTKNKTIKAKRTKSLSEIMKYPEISKTKNDLQFLWGGGTKMQIRVYVNSAPLNITVQNPCTVNHSPSIETAETCFILNSSHPPGTDQFLFFFFFYPSTPIAQACFRRLWLSLWPPPAGCWSRPPWRRTTGRCRPTMDRSSPLRPSGPVCGRTVSLIPQGFPTAGIFLPCWHWRVSCNVSLTDL